MPRHATYDDVTDGVLDDALFSSDISYSGHLRLSMPGDLSYGGIELAVNTPLFSLDLDTAGPWGTEDEFMDRHGYNPFAWSDFDDEPDGCDCESCRRDRGYEDTYDPYGEQTADDPDATALGALPLAIPSLSNRPTRLTSAEIEVGMGGNYLAEEFYKAGLSDSSYMLEYHSGMTNQFVRVEEDASVAAEVIFSKMQLDDVDHAEQFERGVGIIRKAINDGTCKLDMRCGLHIHIGVNRTRTIPGYNSQNLTSLYHLWNYLEDTIFRLASANWKGHRSEFGNNYAPKTHKGYTDASQVSFNRASLNMGNFLSAVRCSVPNYDHPSVDWSEFDMVESVPTIEFRVFNTSANARKIRAYVALCQALVAYAQDNMVTPDILPPHEWTEIAECDPAASEERIKFIMSELPLTHDEKADLLYCIEKCSLAEAI